MEEIFMDEITKIKEENKFLKSKLKEFGYIFPSVGKTLSKEEKFGVFNRYFIGNPIVYAEKYIKKNGQKGYTPKCKHRFDKLKCSYHISGKFNCMKCKNKSYIGINNQILERHFKENGYAIGIYPMFEDNSCYFLAIDFDGDNWFEDMLSVFKSAKKYKLGAIMERSSSGYGGHLWLFFDTRIKALKARRLGNYLLSDAMATNKKLKMNSFDRMFPNQDYLSDDGIGNLIALPLESEAIKYKNTLFINEYEQAIEYQIEYLNEINKVSESQIDAIVGNHDILKDYFFEDNQMTLNMGYDQKYNDEIYYSEDSMLNISKKNLNTITLNTIRRLACMNNPEFYKLQALHKKIILEKTPRVLCEIEESDNIIRIPRGLKELMEKYL